jgi:hypothetical protein
VTFSPPTLTIITTDTSTSPPAVISAAPNLSCPNTAWPRCKVRIDYEVGGSCP